MNLRDFYANVRNTLATIENLVTEIHPPAIIVIGEVVGVRALLGE